MLAVLFVATTSMQATGEISRITTEDVKSARSAVSQFMKMRSEGVLAATDVFAWWPIFRGNVQKQDRRELYDLAGQFAQHVGGDAVVVTNRDGKMLTATDMPSDTAGTVLNDAGTLAALDGRPWTGMTTRGGRIMLCVVSPVSIAHFVWGTVAVYSPMSDQVARELSAVLPPGGQLAFVRNGEVVASSAPMPSSLPLAASALTTVNTAKGAYSALYSPIPGANMSERLGFVVLQPNGPILATFSRFRTGLLIDALIVILVALAAGIVMARNITGPLSELIVAAETLRQGGWPTRLSTGRKDEVGQLQDVFNEMAVAMRASQDRLLALVDKDPLTGLANHRRLQEELAQEVARSHDSGEPLAVLLIDLDRFHAFNQQFGHAAGDRVLEEAAALISSNCPELALCARYGGEEFAVVLPRHNLEQAAAVGEKLVQAIAARNGNVPEERQFTLSVGCADIGVQTEGPEGLILGAEFAIERAKQLGRDQVCAFEGLPKTEEFTDPYRLHRVLKAGSLATIQALAAAVDAKDPYTRGHSRRVAEYAARLAHHAGLEPDEIELIYVSGTLHDVGKIGVPDAILKKTGPLEPHEFAEMAQHPVLGQAIVRNAPQLEPTLPGVRSHHERWDGRGYPDGLVAEKIPLMARILAVADSFDAMTSDRPYRKGLTVEATLAEIERCAGTQLDPKLAMAFVELMRMETEVKEVRAAG